MHLYRTVGRLILAAASMLSAIAITAQQSQPTDVSILVSATDKYDRVVTNLKKQDIRVFEEGSLRPITGFEDADTLPISIEVLIDTSASTGNQSPAVPVLAKMFLQSLMRDGRDTAAITSFSTKVNPVQSTTGDLPMLFSSIDTIVMQPAKGVTAMNSALMAGANRLAVAPGRRMILLVSDGLDNAINQPSRKQVIQTLQRNDVAVYPLYCFCGPSMPGEPAPLRINLENWGGMTNLAKVTGGTPYLPSVGNAQTVYRDFRQIAREIATQRVVSFQPNRRTDTQSLRKIRIEVANPELKGLKFKYRERY